MYLADLRYSRHGMLLAQFGEALQREPHHFAYLPARRQLSLLRSSPHSRDEGAATIQAPHIRTRRPPLGLPRGRAEAPPHRRPPYAAPGSLRATDARE